MNDVQFLVIAMHLGIISGCLLRIRTLMERMDKRSREAEKRRNTNECANPDLR